MIIYGYIEKSYFLTLLFFRLHFFYLDSLIYPAKCILAPYPAFLRSSLPSQLTQIHPDPIALNVQSAIGQQTLGRMTIGL